MDQRTCLSVADLKEATKAVIQNVQRETFSVELKALEAGNKIKGSSSICKLHPILLDGLIRVGGRLNKAQIDFDTKHPVILPYDHHVTGILIRDCHEREGHVGREQVLCSLRERYWIVKGNAAVRKVLKKCITCRPVSSSNHATANGRPTS